MITFLYIFLKIIDKKFNTHTNTYVHILQHGIYSLWYDENDIHWIFCARKKQIKKNWYVPNCFAGYKGTGVRNHICRNFNWQSRLEHSDRTEWFWSIRLVNPIMENWMAVLIQDPFIGDSLRSGHKYITIPLSLWHEITRPCLCDTTNKPSLKLGMDGYQRPAVSWIQLFNTALKSMVI